jgi:hypothetical protein
VAAGRVVERLEPLEDRGRELRPGGPVAAVEQAGFALPVPEQPRHVLGQCTSLRFTEHLTLKGMAPSIGSVRNAYDNGLKETAGLYKIECIRPGLHPERLRTIADLEYATMPGSTGTTIDACAPASG